MLLHSNILGEGTPLLILHGFLGMSDNWKTLGKRFALEGFQVHLIDQRNHGRSFHSDDFSYELLVEDLKYYCSHHRLDEVCVIGHSMGGKTAMLFSVTHSEMVSKLIVADIAPKFYPIHHQQILSGLAALNFKSLKGRREADEVLADYVSEPSTRQFLLKNLYWVEKGVLDLRVNLASLTQNVEEIGESLPMGSIFRGETLFLRGDRSEYIVSADQETILQHFTKAKIKTIENAGHWLHAENPEMFFGESLFFLNS